MKRTSQDSNIRCFSSLPFRDKQTEPISATTAEQLAQADDGGAVLVSSSSYSPSAMCPVSLTKTRCRMVRLISPPQLEFLFAISFLWRRAR
jgi:hypothetical protein